MAGQRDVDKWWLPDSLRPGESRDTISTGWNHERDETWLPEGSLWLSRVQPEEHEWLWPGRIPAEAITILDGDPGLGKSLVALDLIARVTTGRELPDGTPWPHQPGRALLLAAEDDLTMTILPRLEAAGADLSRVAAMRAAPIYDDSDWDKVLSYEPVVLPRHIKDLENAIEEAQAWFVVIDPLVAYLDPRVNTWRDSDVRAALMPLAQVAKKMRIAMVCVRHLNKSSGANALYRGSGSIGIIGLARSGLLVAKSPDDPEHKRILASTKSNLGPPVPSLRYRIQATSDDPYSQAVRIEWLGPSAHTATSLLSEASSAAQAEVPVVDEAVEFLREALGGGPRPVQEVEREARLESLNASALKRACARLRVRKAREGFGPGGRWMWSLPTAPSEPATTSQENMATPVHEPPSQA